MGKRFAMHCHAVSLFVMAQLVQVIWKRSLTSLICPFYLCSQSHRNTSRTSSTTEYCDYIITPDDLSPSLSHTHKHSVSILSSCAHVLLFSLFRSTNKSSSFLLLQTGAKTEQRNASFTFSTFFSTAPTIIVSKMMAFKRDLPLFFIFLHIIMKMTVKNEHSKYQLPFYPT